MENVLTSEDYLTKGAAQGQLVFCSEYNFPCTNPRRDLSIMYPGNQEVYQINQVLSKSTPTSSALS